MDDDPNQSFPNNGNNPYLISNNDNNKNSNQQNQGNKEIFEHSVNDIPKTIVIQHLSDSKHRENFNVGNEQSNQAQEEIQGQDFTYVIVNGKKK